MIEKHDKIIPMEGEQRFAYQCENVDTVCKIQAYIPHQKGTEPYPNKEKNEVSEYVLEIQKFTSNSLSVSLIKRYKNKIVKQYQITVSFSQLVNQIFKNLECNIYDFE